MKRPSLCEKDHYCFDNVNTSDYQCTAPNRSAGRDASHADLHVSNPGSWSRPMINISNVLWSPRRSHQNEVSKKQNLTTKKIE
ncbi:hypothetical protein M422DRAFT_27229 [Sphaerobolus stellatus SS14]|nr:hypothetical protein M422DRAFT_27229 [Sphaerobolus stellatus SS14]